MAIATITNAGRSGVHGADLSHLRSVVLLGGAVRRRQLAEAIGRPAFALPVEPDLTILDLWRRQVALLGQAIGRVDLPLRVMMDATSLMPRLPQRPAIPRTGLAQVQLERDPKDYRGTGGVLRDLFEAFNPDDFLLVGNAAQILVRSLTELAQALAQTEGDVAIVSHADGTPSGLMLLRCAVLAGIAEEGFVDMKEQALPEISRTHRVTVADLDSPSGLPVRTLGEYVEALRTYHRQRSGRPPETDPFAENLQSTFSIVEAGATVDSSARLFDSVVLEGGVVEPRATVVQSIVCREGLVSRGFLATDALVTGKTGRSGRED